MPFKSKSQMRLFWAKVNRGEIDEPVAKEWGEHTRYADLPERERVHPKEKKASAPIKKRHQRFLGELQKIVDDSGGDIRHV